MPTEEEEAFKKRLNRGTYELEPEFFEGFKRSVRNGQTLLALEYLTEYLFDLRAEVTSLKSQIDATTVSSQKTTKSTSAKTMKAEEGATD